MQVTYVPWFGDSFVAWFLGHYNARFGGLVLPATSLSHMEKSPRCDAVVTRSFQGFQQRRYTGFWFPRVLGFVVACYVEM